MNKLKKFWNDHKAVICIVGTTIVIGTAAALILKKYGNRFIPLDCTGVHWKDPGTRMNLEKVKEVLEANKEIASRFVIVKDGKHANQYLTVISSDNFIRP